MTTKSDSDKKVPRELVAGLVLLAVLGILFLKFGFAGLVAFEGFLSGNQAPLAATVVFLGVNAAFAGDLLFRLAKTTKPAHAELQDATRKGAGFSLGRLLLALAVGVLTGTVERILGEHGLVFLRGLPAIYWALQEALDYNMVTAFCASGYWLTGLCMRLPWWPADSAQLPPFPNARNEIVLGAEEPKSLEIEEADGALEPAWVTMSLPALKGNILVSGSIGSGKTQGAVLPYLDQILQNFEPRPALLALDPKRMFIKEAVEVAKRLGLEEHCLHMKLGGRVRYNPIYHPDVLRGSRAFDIAQMLKAAAINSQGRTGSDSFWETSAFNLLRNGLIYCGAVYRYYTLTDLYNVVVKAAKGDITEDLTRALKGETFDAEERFNIERAAVYFGSEFGAFEERLKTNILASSTMFLNQFQDFQAARIFSPKQEEITLKSMDDAVDKGKLIFFDIDNEGLARSLGTLVKLLFQQSLLSRLGHAEREMKRSGVLIIDEFQDVVTSGHGVALGDECFLAKGREANAITIAATQSLTSLKNSLKNDHAANELIQNFRTRIAATSDDLATIQSFQAIVGQVETDKVSFSHSESVRDARENLLTGGVDGANGKNVSDGKTTSKQKEFRVKTEEFASLSMFETLARVFDGSKTTFRRLKLKPYFLTEKATLHADVLALAKKGPRAVLAVALVAFELSRGMAIAAPAPNVCSVVKTPGFDACMELEVSGCLCPGIPPRPCTLISYYRPETFIEVMPEAGATNFGALPAVHSQIDGIKAQALIPFGVEGEIGSHAFQSHVIDIPLMSLVGNFLPCTGFSSDRPCFAAMSEHAAEHWRTGRADLKQPAFLAFQATPKVCLELGAAQSIAGGGLDPGVTSGGNGCSRPLGPMPAYPPSSHSACTGWGPFFPRTGIYEGASQTAAALMTAARIKSLGSEVFQTVDRSPDEKWEMILPGPSTCFREGQNVGFLETGGGVSEIARLAGAPPKGYLVAIWRKVSCCRDYPEAASLRGEIMALKGSCMGGGGP